MVVVYDHCSPDKCKSVFSKRIERIQIRKKNLLKLHHFPASSQKDDEGEEQTSESGWVIKY
jgi:hypothetical protein